MGIGFLFSSTATEKTPVPDGYASGPLTPVKLIAALAANVIWGLSQLVGSMMLFALLARQPSVAVPIWMFLLVLSMMFSHIYLLYVTRLFVVERHGYQGLNWPSALVVVVYVVQLLLVLFAELINNSPNAEALRPVFSLGCWQPVFYRAWLGLFMG